MKSKSATELANLDGIKKLINVTLGSAFKDTSKIVTNDDGLNWMDTLKDTNGRISVKAECGSDIPDQTDACSWNKKYPVGCRSEFHPEVR